MSSLKLCGDYPISPRNKEKYLNLCKKLRDHNFETPWTNLFQKRSTPLVDEDDGIEYTLKCVINTDVTNNAVQTVDEVADIDLKCDTNSKTEACDKIDEDKISTLKETLMEINEGQLPEDHHLNLELFQLTSASLIPLLCEKLELCSLDEAALATIIKGLSCVEPQVSLLSATTFVQCVIYPQVEKLKRNACRALLTSIITFCECYPRAAIEGLFLPCLQSDAFGPVQCDILIKIIKSEIPDDLIFLCERKSLEVAEPTENIFFLIQCMLERKALYELDFYNVLIQKLKDWSLTNSSNIKFTKLLIFVINIFGNQVSDNHLEILSEIVKKNKTVLKRATENALKKIMK